MLEPQPEQSQNIQPVVAAHSKGGFSGKQVAGIVVGVVALLAIGAALGGFIGYRLGTVEGAQQAQINLPASRQAPQSQLPNSNNFGQLPQLPFGSGQIPAVNPGGPYMGVQFQMLTPNIAAREGMTGTIGALVRDLAADGPAAKAGLKVGDVIVAVDGQAVDAQNDLRARVADFKPNDEITLTVVKGTASGPIDQHDLKVKLVERPAEQSFNFEMPFGNGEALPALPFNGQSQPQPSVPAANGPYLGVEYVLLTPEVAAQENMTGTQGALIKSVSANSPAAQAGLKVGDVITAVDGQSFDSNNTLRSIVLAHKVGDNLKLTLAKGTAAGPTDQHDVTVVLAARPAERQFQMPPGSQPGIPSPDSRQG